MDLEYDFKTQGEVLLFLATMARRLACKYETNEKDGTITITVPPVVAVRP